MQIRNQCEPMTNAILVDPIKDIREGSCDWSVLIAHSKNSTQWDTGKHIIAERNRLNEAKN